MGKKLRQRGHSVLKIVLKNKKILVDIPKVTIEGTRLKNASELLKI